MERLDEKFAKLVKLMARLRGKPGCPWDKEQTSHTLKTYLLEEAYEVLEAIEESSPEKLEEELGDLLFQILFLARIFEEEGKFDIGAVIDGIYNKMVRRHPHVFGQVEAKTSAQVLENWMRIKAVEENKGSPASLLSAVPKGLPALLRAKRVSERAAAVGFDWQKAEDVLEKVKEELSEFESALQSKDQGQLKEELGDIFFSLVNLSRFVQVDPDDALSKTIAKFIDRFEYVEKRLSEQGKSLKQASLEEMEQLWEDKKK
ncbi:MAG: nucleoside triphosphate pyrophosphohydrolase [Thermodesulfobacteriota bacterium]